MYFLQSKEDTHNGLARKMTKMIIFVVRGIIAIGMEIFDRETGMGLIM
jgi:hypothetical protein